MIASATRWSTNPKITGDATDRGVEDRSDRWRARRRFLLATLVLAVMYVVLQECWMWGADKVMRVGGVGWTYGDPAKTYAGQAAEVAEQSKAREAGLSTQHPRVVFQLGVQYGYLSRRLGSSGAQPDATVRHLAPPVDRNLQDLHTCAEFLGVGTVEPLTVRTEVDFLTLTQSIEDDVGGVAARVEQVTSPRLRHLFMLGAHAGTEIATLEARDDLTPYPPFALIGKHGTLAAVPEPLWRPLTRLSHGDMGAKLADYRAAADTLDLSLVHSTSSGPPTHK